MRERSRARTGVRRQLFAALGERVQVVGGPRERGEGVAPGLVGQRHGHLGTRGQRLQQRPLSAGEVLEAVREDGLGAPGVEVAAYALGRVAPFELAVPEAQPVELGAIGRVELTELALELTRLEQRGLELGHGRPERIREAAEPGRRAQAAGGLADHAPKEQRALRLGHHRAVRAVPSGEPFEEIVEGADRAADERACPGQELALRPVDVRPVRHDQDRIGLERAEIALEQERDLPGVRRPCEQAERHRPILALGPDGSGPAK